MLNSTFHSKQLLQHHGLVCSTMTTLSLLNQGESFETSIATSQ